MTVYRIGGRPAANIGHMLGVKGRATLVDYTTRPGGDCFKIAAFAADMSVSVDVTKTAENECCDPRDFVVTVRYMNPVRKCMYQFQDSQQVASENAAQADEHFKSCIAENFAYRVGIAHVSFLSEDWRYLRGIGRRNRRI